MAKKVQKILIGEDEKPMARALELKLKSLGFEAKIAFNGEEVLQALQKEKFNLVLLDLMMPKVDGFSVLAKMQENKDKTPVIVASNLSQSEDLQKAKKLGAVDYFVKSDTPIAEVVVRVKKALN
ncbi:response regulator [Candidatus Falkowbacteria bacterium]|jgi:DNA-binding response OmpR family regulator|nr:response regulator [Candidatus Falkowbacteria bacterium]MBT4432971.1 response regulator [Candidatus Falkowbacteria bacterium]